MKGKKIYMLIIEEAGRTTTTPHRSRKAVYRFLAPNYSYRTFLNRGASWWEEGKKITIEKKEI